MAKKTKSVSIEKIEGALLVDFSTVTERGAKRPYQYKNTKASFDDTGTLADAIWEHFYGSGK